MDRVETYVKFKYGIVWKTCQKVLPVVGVHLLRWIATYPVDKVIHSLNNWGLVRPIAKLASKHQPVG